MYMCLCRTMDPSTHGTFFFFLFFLVCVKIPDVCVYTCVCGYRNTLPLLSFYGLTDLHGSVKFTLNLYVVPKTVGVDV